MLALFTLPKPFTGPIGVIQRNALASWRRSLPDAEIYVCGDEPGAKQAAHEVGATFIPDVERNEYATPLLGATFRRVAGATRRPLLAYVNADIILLPDLADAIGRLGPQPFLLVSRRWNLDLDEALEFGAGWDICIAERARREGELFRRDALDLFVFPRDSPVVDLPQFAVGRPGWDNYFIFRARQLGLRVIDATPSITVVHQNHGYGHVPAGTGDRWEGPEARRNRSLMGGSERFFDIGDATHVLEPTGLRKARGLRHLVRRIETVHLTVPALAFVGRLGFAMRGLPVVGRRLMHRLGWVR